MPPRRTSPSTSIASSLGESGEISRMSPRRFTLSVTCKVRKSKVLSAAEDLTDATIQGTEDAFEEVVPAVEKHRKSILKKIVKEAKEAGKKWMMTPKRPNLWNPGKLCL